MSGVVFGTVSYLGDDTRFLEQRVKMHSRQVEWIDEIQAKMQAKGAPALPWWRVEQCWNDERKELLKSSGDYLESLEYTDRIPLGRARNILLEKFYNSDYDWIVMMDDDMGLYDHYDGYEMLWNLAEPRFIELARQAYILMPFPAYWNGFTEEVNKFGKSETHWLFLRTIHTCTPFACFPNIKKHRGIEVWFDGETECALPGEAPEDLKFGIDWIKATGGRWLECRNMIGKSFGNLNYSSIFPDAAARDARVATDGPWVAAYLKTLYPRNPNLWTKKDFLKRKNPFIQLQVPRHVYKKED